MVAQHTTALEALLVDSSFNGEVYCNEPLARRTTYHIGGPARFYVQVNGLGALIPLIKACDDEDLPWIVLGKGSNILASDKGYEGLIITLGGDFKSFKYHEDKMSFTVGAGVNLAKLVQEAYKRSLAGLEFAVGTPGTVGGAVRMNAGSAQEWIGARIRSLTVYEPKSGLHKYFSDELQWGYRESSLPLDAIILECELVMGQAPTAHIRGKMEALLNKRKRSQPLTYPSCGSVFKNPEGESAGRLIEDVGLKGTRIGGAQISEQHANFIVNTGGASSEDVVALIHMAQEKGGRAYGIELQPEVKFLGFS